MVVLTEIQLIHLGILKRSKQVSSLKGIPFRDAHEVVGKSVAYCVDKSCDIAELSLDELKQFSDAIGDDVFDYLTLEGSVAARDHIGGTAPNQVRFAIEQARLRAEAKHAAS